MKEKVETKIYEPPHDKTNKMTCAPSEDSDSSTWASAQSDEVQSEESDQTGLI